MEKTILLRFGEIYLKGRNKQYFEKILLNNIKYALKNNNFTLSVTRGRYFIENYLSEEEDEIIEKLKRVIGLHSLSRAVKIKTDIEEIKKASVNFAGDTTFRVTVKRADNSIKISSTRLSGEIGAYILSQKPNLKVDLFNFDKEVYIDMRENGFTYILSDKIMCEHGMPVGTSGNGMLLLSGGIDSPVAGFRMIKRGVKLKAVHFHSFPYTSELAKQKVIDLAAILAKYGMEIELYIVPFTEVQEEIHKNCDNRFMITIMRRIMMRISEILARKSHCGAIITGESLGQVASQTMQSIYVTNSVVQMPVFRPLIGMDKEEIILTAKHIGTFETSILPYEDCCTVFLPENPVIKPVFEEVVEQEKKLDIETLVKNAIENTEKQIITNKE